MTVRFVIKVSQYFDSVSLMNVARDVQALPGVEDAALVMGTAANKALLEQVGPITSEVEAASANDLILMVKGDEAVLDGALATAEKLLAKPAEQASAGGWEHRPKTLRGALRGHPDANLVVVSVAGAYATAEAWNALRQGKHVLLFSDNVSLEDEIALKQYAVENGLLLMGPGAGTAIINNVALGFANVIPPGPVGIISAAGTGLQEVSTLLAKQGIGLTQGIGVGGRDLSDPVGGLMMFHALNALRDDPDTQIIVAISKIPSPDISEKMLSSLADCGKPAVVIFMGPEQPLSGNGLYMASTLQEAALAAAVLAQGGNPSTVKAQLADRAEALKEQAATLKSRLDSRQKYLRGLFSGGTLCEEAMRIWGKSVREVWSNAPLDAAFTLPDSYQSQEHCALDLGEEEFTVGRPHPMIDNDLRIRRLLQEAADPQVGAILLDVVLGYGAHLDPASELAPAIRRARETASEQGRELIVITALTGTDGDPQNLSRQTAALGSAGALPLGSNAEASQLAAFVVSQ